MGRKRNKTETIHVMSSLEHTEALMPKYNPAICGTGIWKPKRDYDRNRNKKELREEIKNEMV